MGRGTSAVLVVFARRPVPGEVKTRLGGALGDAGAAAVYAAFLSDLTRRLRTAPFGVRWSIAPPLGDFAARFGLSPDACAEQVGGDLGERMHAAFRAAAADGIARCALIGSDLPHLPLDRLVRAFAALDRADLVLGPARDGGYYLVAMRAPHDVFSGIRWSEPDVLDATLAKAVALGLRTALLEEDFDVDTPADLERLRALLGERPDIRAEMPATAAALGLGGAAAPALRTRRRCSDRP